MNHKRLKSIAPAGLAAAALAFAPYAYSQAQDAQTPDEVAARLQALKKQVEEQTRQLDLLKRSVAEQEASLNDVRRAVAKEVLATQRGGQGTPAPAPDAAQQAAQAPANATAQAPTTPVGQAPEGENIGPLSVARILELPGVLTQKGMFVVEPSLAYSNSSSLRVSLVGYTIIPAILVGLIDVRDVRRNTLTAALRASYGVTNRFEVEGRIPYLYRSDSAVGREYLGGSSFDEAVFNGSGNGIGDVEVTARYQLNEGGLDKPYFVGSMRFKSRTGRDPYEGTFTTTVPGFRGEAVQTQLPTGTGFYGLQGGLTVLYPSDPVVLFGGINYLYSFPRDNVSLKLEDGSTQNIGHVAPGGIVGFNFGIGLGLNEKMSLSLGYDQNSVEPTKINGQTPADAVRLQLGTMLVGLSYRMTPTSNLNFTLGVGVTRDAPDVTLSLRYPMSF
ncbi:MAG TPA: acetate kinase [Burkholderiaceae bacterium]|nr:acetate kinase [Burkholderiaceae bacterium]